MRFELTQLQCPAKTQEQIQLVLEELFANLFKHGYTGTLEP